MRKFHINIRRSCAIIVGAVFFVSGILKLMDPVGTSLIVSEYLKFLHLGFLLMASKALGIAIPLVEALCGAALVAGIWRKPLSFLALSLLGLFTLLTLAILIFNPSMDCGCFGEAVHFSHLASFLKNVVLLSMAVLAFIPIRVGMKPRTLKFVAFALVAAGILFFSYRSNRRLPMVDFTDYTPTDSVLVDGNVLVFSVYDPDKLGFEEWTRISESIGTSTFEGVTSVLLVSDLEAVPVDLEDYAIFHDRRDIMTLNRSNGGVTLLSDGTIISKSPYSSLPPENYFSALRDSDPLELLTKETVRGRIGLELMILGSLAILMLI